jgi:MbtH protein
MEVPNGEQTFEVVRNGEDQYSIWPEYKTLPQGWTTIGWRGSKVNCLAHIEEVWIDMRPRSLRISIEESMKSRTAK